MVFPPHSAGGPGSCRGSARPDAIAPGLLQRILSHRNAVHQELTPREGVGPKPIQRSELTVRKLVEALAQATTDMAMQQRAAALGEALGQEDGVANAVRTISAYLDAPGGKP